MASERDSLLHGEETDWDNMEHVIYPIPPYMCTVFDELSQKYDYSDFRFRGMNHIRLRLSDERQVYLYSPDEIEAAAYQHFVGKFWIPYELVGKDIENNSPAWVIQIDVGVNGENLNAGLQFFVKFTSFPNEIYTEQLCSTQYNVSSLSEWTTLRDTALEELAQLSRNVEYEVEFAQSNQSTPKEREDDEL
jgi:hypothetical protein